MKGKRSLFATLVLTGILGPSVATPAADNIPLENRSRSAGNYCHMQFPAIRESTLNWDRPVLKPRTTGDVIDFYGHCNHNPTGREEAKDQRNQMLSANIDD